jgi:hypothetical protein
MIRVAAAGDVHLAPDVRGRMRRLPGGLLGIAGTKGFGGGFPNRSASEFGEPEMKAFVRHSRELAEAMGEALRELDAGFRVALTYYSPVAETLAGEPPEIYPRSSNSRWSGSLAARLTGHGEGRAQAFLDAAHRRCRNRTCVRSHFVVVDGFDVVAGDPAGHDLLRS